MPRYTVTVRYEMEREINVYAKDEGEAEDKACEIVMDWNGVITADATDVEEAVGWPLDIGGHGGQQDGTGDTHRHSTDYPTHPHATPITYHVPHIQYTRHTCFHTYSTHIYIHITHTDT